ncbi:hypothetical protein BHE74_00044904, partial [Ensete ventricosum]
AEAALARQQLLLWSMLLPLLAVALAIRAAPWGLATGGRSLREPCNRPSFRASRCKWLCPWAVVAPISGSPCGLALVASSRPLAGGQAVAGRPYRGLGCGQPPL